MQMLLDLLRGRLPDSLNDGQWSTLLNVAEEENLLPWAAERLRSLGGHCTQEQMRQLDAILREAQVASFVWTQTLKGTMAEFRKADVEVISLKGPCLAERLYGDAALRSCYDLDLLVRPSDLARAEHLLGDMGFSPHGEADDYHRRWLRKATVVELHHELENPHAFAIDLDGLWARSAVSQFQRAPVQLLAPCDELHYLCLHAARHRFDRLCLLLDLAFAFRRLPLPSGGAPGWNDPVFDNMVALASIMAARLDPQFPEPQDLRLRPRDRRRLEQLADRLWNERLLAPAQALDWRSQHRFFLEVENPGWRRALRRWRHLRILLTRLIDADFAFARRFHLRRKWQVRLLRPFRLLMKALRLSPETRQDAHQGTGG